MKRKIKEYIELIFADAPDCAKTREMKEEMYANVCDRYDDLIAEGKSETAAYNACVSGIGDISELIDSIEEEQREKHTDSESDNPYSDYGFKREFTFEEKQQIEKYRIRRGIMNAVAIALYILCWVPLVLISTIMGFAGEGGAEIGGIIGVAVMMVMIAAATVLMVLKSSIKPLCLKGVKNIDGNGDDDDDDDDDGDDEKAKKDKKPKRQKNPAIRILSSVLWSVTTAGYLLIGFLLGAWHPGWIVFIIATAIDNVIEAIFELAGKKYV